MNAPLVQKGPIATASIDQPELADILQLDERVHSGNFRQVQNKSIGGSSPHRTTPAEGVALAVRFEPRALFLRLIHQTVSTKSAEQAKQSRVLIFVNYRPRVKVRCFAFIAVSSRSILAA